MGTISVTTFGADPQTVNAANLNALVTPIITECNGKLDNTNIVAAAGIVDTKLATITTAGKVNTSALTTTSQAAGDVLYNNGTNWVRLAKDAGKYLKSGASAVSWDVPAVSFKIGTFTRDVTAAGADVSYTGVGFQPGAILFLSNKDAGLGFSIGFDNLTAMGTLQTSANNVFKTNTTASIYHSLDGNTTSQEGKIKSFDADGFTITWAKTGSPAAGTLNVMYLAIK